MNSSNYFYWNVGDLPFMYNFLTKESDIPNSVPFSVYINQKTGVLTQDLNDEIKDYLTKIYRSDIILLKDVQKYVIENSYIESFIFQLQNLYKKNNFTNFDVLEIGCRNGYLLHRLKGLGANVTGIDSKRNIDLEKVNIKIIRDLFPTNKLRFKFDLVILYFVLDHFFDPIENLREIKKYLKKDGKVIVVVEDSEPYFRSGDISVFQHQHISYYTKETLIRNFKVSGFKNIKEVWSGKSEIGNILFFEATSGSDIYLTKDNISVRKQIEEFKFKSEIIFRKFLNFVLDHYFSNKSIGIYKPEKSVNFLHLMKGPFDKIRFFDDDPFLNNRVFPSISIQIESHKELLVNPTDTVLIFDRLIGNRIKEELVKFLPKNTNIQTVDENILNIGD